MQECAIGIDLGGTKIEIAIVDNTGKVLDKLRIPTETSGGADKIIETITEAVENLSKKHPGITTAAIGIGVAGQTEEKTGTIIYAPNLEWHNVNLQEQLTNKLHKPVAVCNDVKAAAWGEWLHGAGKGCDDWVCIFVGTGIGGAIVSNGKMLEGCNNTAGETGHITIQLHGPVCHCGNEGCFEALAGGWAIERDAQQAVQNNNTDGKMLLEIAWAIKAITAKTVIMAAQKGDVLANKLVDNVACALIAGITSVVNMLGPCRVVLGGGIIEGMPEMIGRIEEGVKKYALKAAIPGIKILPAKLHNDSGVIGAAAYALNKRKNNKV